MEKTIKFKKLVNSAQLPTYAHDGDIGMDVYAVGVEYDAINDAYIYHTGIACETEGHMGVLGMMKSSVYKHCDAYLTNGVGLIDSDQYRGEILFIYKNRTPLRQRLLDTALKLYMNRSLWWKLGHSFEHTLSDVTKLMDPLQFAPYQVGEAVGQLVPLTFDKMKIEETEELSDTERGTGGFGSTAASKKKSPHKKKSKTTLKID